MAKAIALRSIGCRTNQQEMTALGFRLLKDGHRLVDRIEEAEVVVINTCSVTSETEAKTRRMLRQVSRRTPHIDICVTGCLAQQKADEIKREPNVRWVVGNTCKNEIPDILQNNKDGVFRESRAGADEPFQTLSEAPIFFDARRRTRFSIKIQEGCDFRCAYCIVPFLRGASRCASMKDVTRACKRAIDAGFKEIVLTGTHIGQYHDESDGGLLALVENLSILSGDFRIRLSSLDPRDLSKELIDIIGAHQRFCQHLHVSVQSFSPKVLAAMNRPSSDIGSIIEALMDFRERFPEAGIGGDFIVGFPGETEADFEETLSRIETIGFSYGHVFRFSKRPMTAAAGFSGQTADKEKSARSARMRGILDRNHNAFVRKLIGTHHRIIVEKENPITGRASNYLSLEAPGASARRNEWLMVAINGMHPITGRCQAMMITRGAQ